MVHAPAEPTHYCEYGRPEILDICLAKKITQTIEIKSLSELSSDHNPITTELNKKTITTQTETKKVNWTKFHYYLRTNTASIRTLNNTQQIDEEIETLTSEIQAAVAHATTVIKKPTEAAQPYRNT